MPDETDLFLALKEDYQEALERLNEALLLLESEPENRDALGAATRQLHNIKGFANRMGAPKLGQMAHILEDLLAGALGGRFPVGDDLADLLFRGLDLFVHYLRSRDVPTDQVARLVEESEGLLFPAGEREGVGEDVQKLLPDFVAAARENVAAINQGLFKLEHDPADRDTLQEVYRHAHSLKGSALTMGFERMGKLAHRMEDVLRACQDGSLPVTSDICDALVETNDALSTMLETVAASKRMKLNVEGTIAQLERFLSKLRPGDARRPRKAIPPEPVVTPAVPVPAIDTVRVPIGKLDDLVNLAGEAAIGHTRLATAVEDLARLRERWRRFRAREDLRGRGNGGDGLKAGVAAEELFALGRDLEETSRELEEAAESTGRLIENLQHRSMEIRMLPLAIVFGTLPKAVRDLSRQFGKRVDFLLEGTETIIDKRILEQIGDPLIHLLRNALDHGIETPEERRQLGKPEVGTLLLRARHDGSKVVLTLEDDGRGIDPELLKETALRRGFLDKREADLWSESQLYDLVFLPGFSTSPIVTDISGRGMGLDVVRTNVEKLKGQVQVTSRLGTGARFVISLPLTLATIQALMIRCAGEIFAVPMFSVAKTLQLAREAITPIQGKLAIVEEEEVIPVRSLATALGWQEDEEVQRNARLMLVVLQAGERKTAFVVEDILGGREIVTKELGGHLHQVRYLAGATILGSGQVALILDVPTLVWQDIAEAREECRWLHRPEALPSRHQVILVVEDQVVTRQMEKSILEAAGYRVVTAENGLDAIEKLQQHQVDLVVTDIHMPHMDGFLLTERIRGDQATAALPVVVVTSLGQEEDRLRGLRAGANAYLIKSSFDQRLLIDTIETLLGKAACRPEA
ncbi:MAG TPA: hybrid sensor histidine kinase/response regulator [Syntrophobacteria bacterium]|nr:hybrid sensor histidine kinase/response regulator [Syntrophobacteria bacterium]